MKYSVHPVAALFPMIPTGSQSWNNLVQSIKDVGQIDPVVIDGTTLIDGRNRLAACEVLNIQPKTVQWSALGIRVDIAEWILAKNIERRNLTDEQRVTIYVEYEAWRLKEEAAKRQKEGKKVADDLGLNSTQGRRTREKVVEATGVSQHKARQALKLDKAISEGKAAPELREQVKAGEVSLKDAVKSIEPKPETETPIERCSDKIDPAVAAENMRLAQAAIGELKKIKKGSNGSLAAFDAVMTWISKQHR